MLPTIKSKNTFGRLLEVGRSFLGAFTVLFCLFFLGKCLELSSDTATGSFEIPILDSWLYRSSVTHDLSSTPALLFN